MTQDNADNPIVLYIVVRKDLGMSSGKIAVQVGHVVQKLLFRYFTILALSATKNNKTYHFITDEETEHTKLLTLWAENSSTKIVKGANDKEWARLKEEHGKNMFIIKDNGLTEIAPGSETVGCIWPLHRNDVPKMIWNLQNLK